MSAGHTVYEVTFYSVILLFVVIIDWTVTPLNESPECVVLGSLRFGDESSSEGHVIIWT